MILMLTHNWALLQELSGSSMAAALCRLQCLHCDKSVYKQQRRAQSTKFGPARPPLHKQVGSEATAGRWVGGQMAAEHVCAQEAEQQGRHLAKKQDEQAPWG